ncbi:putative colon cancer-associated protein Mic1 [Ancylostoma ceylanicum]|uniref:Putative colon cancer-associated protein Mic1 n=1 Tax=Ancylostoma ceylanicum TaxID=53326 RepID=A0A0D6L6K6_9BILA|nr:putative colon cancer-associated protein Mic1 [Ancylostoma ceylanicum]
MDQFLKDTVLLEKSDGATAVEFNVPTKSRDMILSVDWISNNQAKSSLVVVATGSNCTTLQPFLVQHGQFTRLKGIAKSMIFDVALSPNRPTHSPLITVSIKPSPVCQPPPALYIPLWSMFQPDIVVDPVAGMMYQLTVRCSLAHEEIHEKAMLIEFLIHRTGQKQLVLDTLLNSLKAKELRLRQIRKLFDLIVEKFSLSTGAHSNGPESTKPQLQPIPVHHLRIEQREMQSSIFIPLMEDPSTDSKFVADVMLQYLRSLHRWSVSVEVISDSKPLAFLLLSYEARCPSLFQSGVDILARQKACDEIVEVLLERGHVIDAMRYLDTQQMEANSLKLLDAAKQQDRVVQHAVLTHIINRKNKEDVSKLEGELNSLFTEEEIKEAADEVAKAVQFT